MPGPNRAGRSPSAAGGARGAVSRGLSMLGNRATRYNRMLDKYGMNSVLMQVPEGVGVEEYNYVLGTGPVAVAAGATQAFSVNAPRDLILRKMVVQNQLLISDVDATVVSITIEGNAALLGGPVGIGMFAPNSFYNPSLDLPVSAGTPITVNVTNGSAAAAEYSVSFTID